MKKCTATANLKASVLWLLPVMLAIPATAQTESDFAPLAVGNTWEYHGTGGYAVSGVSMRYARWRTIRILTKNVQGNASLYTAGMHDSSETIWGFDLTVKPEITISDTVFSIVEGESAIQVDAAFSNTDDEMMIRLCFRSHSYPSAEVVMDTAMGKTVRVVKKIDRDTAYTLVQNAGLCYFSYQYGHPGAFLTEYKLLEYKAETISVLPQRRSRPWRFPSDCLKGRDWLGKAK